MRQLNKYLHEVNYGLFGHELVVDNFAGAGGTSEGIEDALQRPIDLAINHCPLALAVHHHNHPDAKHEVADVWDIKPETATAGQPVGLCWFSPDCRHHSHAKGGRPVSKSVRGLAWVAARWAATVKPRVIVVENVKEFMEWGPLSKGPDGKVRPCPKRKGQTFQAYTRRLKRHGYTLEWRVLKACDYGVPTIRERFFLIARCDGLPIVWPKPTHAAPHSLAVRQGKLEPWRTAAECIDWTILTNSIFNRSKPLVDATLRRVASGVFRYVLQNPKPYVVKLNHTASYYKAFSGEPLDKPLHKITTTPGFTQASSTLDPMPEGALSHEDEKNAQRVAAFLEAYAPASASLKRDAAQPVTDTATTPLEQQMAAFMLNMKGSQRQARDIRHPLSTICAGSTHAYVTVAFLAPYYGNGSGLTGRDITAPMPTITTKDRLKLVTVTLDGETYALVDIGIRMLQPHELAMAQGFPAGYEFAEIDGKKIAKNKQVQLIGNSVPPPLARAIVEANFTHEQKFTASLVAA